MQLARRHFVARSRPFGRAPARVLTTSSGPAWTLPEDVKLFAATFVVGFVFVSILIG